MKPVHSRALWLLVLPFLVLGGCSLEVDRSSDAYLYHHDRWDGVYGRTYVVPRDRDRAIIRDDHGYAHERW